MHVYHVCRSLKVEPFDVSLEDIIKTFLFQDCALPDDAHPTVAVLAVAGVILNNQRGPQKGKAWSICETEHDTISLPLSLIYIYIQ